MNANLSELLAKRRVVVLLGAGGVGKTTTSIALALAAAQSGRRVALLSIDPAKRLASALGIELGNDLKPIHWPKSIPISGFVEAAMLDHKAVFDKMVHAHAPSEKIAHGILENPIYQAASTNLIGPLEYMALAKLQELSENPRYDLIVLDTPPDVHALDFLARPNVLSGFFDSKVMAWLIKPFVIAGHLGFGKLMTMGERLMGGVAKVTGFSALHKFADFLILIQEVIEGFNRSGEKVLKLLKEKSTGFLLVTTPTKTSMRSSTNIAEALAKLGYGLDLVVVNRSLSETIRAALNQHREEKERFKEQLIPANAFEGLLRRFSIEKEIEANLESLIHIAGAQRGNSVSQIFISELSVDDAPDGGIAALGEIAGQLLPRS